MTKTPQLLTEEQKVSAWKRQKYLLKMYQKYNYHPFANIVAGDETWVYFYEPQQKVLNMSMCYKNT